MKKLCTSVIVATLLTTSPSTPASPPAQTGFVGAQLIKQFEGLRLCRYVDDAGHPTIGYGHKIVDEDLPTCISPKKAYELLRKDMAAAERCVRFYIDAPLTQGHFDALVSFTFNLGCGSLNRSTLRTKLNQLDYEGAAAEFPRWNKARVDGKLTELRGLTLRRWAERHVFEG